MKKALVLFAVLAVLVSASAVLATEARFETKKAPEFGNKDHKPAPNATSSDRRFNQQGKLMRASWTDDRFGTSTRDRDHWASSTASTTASSTKPGERQGFFFRLMSFFGFRR